MIRLPLLGLYAVAALTFASSALADDAACLDGASKGQRFRATHKLLEAREQLRICAAAACPTVVQSDCAGWLAAVERALPSVVVTATDETGTSLIDVKVAVDGQPFLSRLDGHAVSINPGPHTFRFEGPGGATIEQVVLAAEGVQNQRVAAVLGKKAARSEANPAKESPAALPQAPAPGDGGAPRGGTHWKMVGWVAGAAGVLGLGLGAFFGMKAIDDNNQAMCNENHVCLTGPLNEARSDAQLSTVAFVAGGILAAAGVGIVLFAPAESGTKGKAPAGVTATLSPTFASNAGGFRVGGSW